MFERMIIEDWFDKYQFKVDYDIGESGVKFFKLGDLNLDLADVDLRYTHHLGDPELRSEIAKQYKGLNWDNIAVTTGSSEAIFSIIASLLTSKDHLIIEFPNYPSYFYISQSLDRQFDLFPLKSQEKFKPNIDTLEKLIKPNTKLICLTHPNNPTGSMITLDELKRIIEIVEKKNIYLLMDETYRDLAFGEKLPTAASLSDKVISVSTMSKVYGLPGIRIGWLATRDKSVIDGVLNVREQITICNSALNEAIAFQVLQKRDQLLKKIRKNLDSNYKIIREWITYRDDLEMVEPTGGVTCFPRLKSGQSSKNLAITLVEKYRTFIVPGFVFDMDPYFRIGFGGSSEEIKGGLLQLEKGLSEYLSLE